MSLRIQSVCFDTEDPIALATFWENVLGWRRTYEAAGDQVVLEPPAGSPEEGILPDLLFLAAPGGKKAKNRVHLDLRPDDQEAEVARVEALGARRVDIGQSERSTWVVLADPDGNEFCVLSAQAD